MVAILKGKVQCTAEHMLTGLELPVDRNEWMYVPGCMIYYCQLMLGHKGNHQDCKGQEWTPDTRPRKREPRRRGKGKRNKGRAAHTEEKGMEGSC